MDIVTLLTKISIHYPSFHTSKSIAEEWYRLIGYKDLDECLDRLDDWLLGEEKNNRPPGIKWFATSAPEKKKTDEVFHDPTPHEWHLVFAHWDVARMHGRLYDEEDREYVHDPMYEDGYHYDTQGRICTSDGRVLHV